MQSESEKAYKDKWYAEHREEILKKRRRYYAENKDEFAVQNKQYYLANPDKVKARHAKYYAENKDKVLERNKHYNATHNAAKLERGKRWVASHREQRRTYERQYEEINRDRIVEQRRLYNAAHPESNQNRCARRRARQMKATINDFTGDQWVQLQELYNHKCRYCAKELPLTMDHMQPISRGGDHTMSNIVPACLSCNDKKGTKSYAEFALTRWDGWD